MKYHFFKMQGCGNDFLFLDCVGGDPIRFRPEEVSYWCDRHFGIGADGIAVLQSSERADAKWDFFNSDGSKAEMCGNAARCAIRFLSERYFPTKESISLETLAGVISGKRLEDDRIEITLSPNRAADLSYEEKVLQIEEYTFDLFCINTGVPHAVLEVNDIRTYPIERVGRLIQAHPAFQPEGTNVTYFQRLGLNQILSTTFERGVEAETFACGTGAAAAAQIFSERYLQKFPIEVKVPGGDLAVDLSPEKKLLLRGPAMHAFEVEVLAPDQNHAAPVLYGDRKGSR